MREFSNIINFCFNFEKEFVSYREIYVIRRPGGPYLLETVPEMVSTGAQDRGQSFSTDLPWTVNNLFLSRFFNPTCFFDSSRPYKLRTMK